MPWCDDCDRFLTPTSLGRGGTCPSCGRVVAAGDEAAGGAEPAGPGAQDRKVPWHFKLLVGATVVYLGWRAVQGVSWLVHHVHV